MDQLAHYHARRSKLILEMGGKCYSCGNTEALEFDHVDKSKKSFTISSKMSYSIDTIREELKKCQLLCHLCHKEKNKKDNGESKHGMYSMYKHHKCRCRKCKDVYNIYRRKWRATARSKGKIY